MATRKSRKDDAAPTEERNVENLVQEFIKLKQDAKKKGLKNAEVREIFLGRRKPSKRAATWVVRVVVGILFPCLLAVGLQLHQNDFDLENLMESLTSSPCAVEFPTLLDEMTRPIADCSMCKGIRSAPVLENISKEDFLQKYAYSGVPLLVKGATKSWTAMEAFSYEFLKDLYEGTEGALDAVNDDCQFFPYNTDFGSLEEAFNMSDARSELREGEESWYFGWSNCDQTVASALRKHYQKPYFLPDDSESSITDWLFMGWSGVGASIHIDHVDRPSWQAMILGSKTWTLIPPPECEDVCYTFNITLNQGDIIIVDTNQWFHSTYIHPGQLSLTIGSEYD
ncbi:PREDICTED: bifunctional arginine demethylase and lysyl-hydroxylase JMJD6-like [Branchiostoma belcheri]|uniref:Bifunctional arginine demethylase and lysyl-hydroxylase JMJD6-like n=1 Tax=Branchiostoma belcheri TaxID=7741 RepID=A0A6P5AQP5_BRABE|nr:PREDICTED: bifunctional arginine demethylase and lysyl-hydroxylase JMJD6-like [Branchiostoma belcheri]